MATRKVIEVDCVICGDVFKSKNDTIRSTCSATCRDVLRMREASQEMSAGAVADAMDAIIANEVALPWEKKSHPVRCFMAGKRS